MGNCISINDNKTIALKCQKLALECQELSLESGELALKSEELELEFSELSNPGTDRPQPDNKKIRVIPNTLIVLIIIEVLVKIKKVIIHVYYIK